MVFLYLLKILTWCIIALRCSVDAEEFMPPRMIDVTLVAVVGAVVEIAGKRWPKV